MITSQLVDTYKQMLEVKQMEATKKAAVSIFFIPPSIEDEIAIDGRCTDRFEWILITQVAGSWTCRTRFAYAYTFPPSFVSDIVLVSQSISVFCFSPQKRDSSSVVVHSPISPTNVCVYIYISCLGTLLQTNTSRRRGRLRKRK
jgi:hypothetical protein